MTADTTLDAHPSLLQRAHLPFAIGAVALVTLGAFENRAVMTVLPSVADDLDGLWLFGAAAAAPLISFVVATTVAGLWSDRRGPVPVLYAGMGLFVAGELLMGLAPLMGVFVAGRLVGGLAEGLLDVGLTVLVARALPPQLRPKIFATFAAAWVLPSLIGPSVAGVIAEQVSWRAVFLVGIALLVPVWWFLRPALGAPDGRAATDQLASPDARRQSRSATQWAFLAALGLSALTAGASLVTRSGLAQAVGGLLLVAALAALVPALHAILPAGALRGAPGIPALTLLRGLLGAAFGATGGLIPLMLTEVHGYGPAQAGVSLTITGLFWAAGSQVQGLAVTQRRTSVVTRLRTGFVLLTIGVAGPALLAVDVLPAWAGLGLWALAGVGMGVSSPTISTHVLALSTPADQGRNSAATFLAPSVSQAVAYAVSGAAIAWTAPQPGGTVFGALMAGSVALAAVGALLAPRAR
jgi:MFS family permease